MQQVANILSPVHEFIRNLAISHKQNMRRQKALARRRQISNTQEFMIDGILETGAQSHYRIGNLDLSIDANTWIFGRLEVGAEVFVRGIVDACGRRYAKKIIIKKEAKLSPAEGSMLGA